MKACFSLVLAVLVSACAASDNAAYPSLSPRPIEKLDLGEPAPVATTLTPADPVFADRLKAARADLAESKSALDTAIKSAKPAVPGAKWGSEEWVDNQTALSSINAAQAHVRNVETNISAIMADLALARVSGADTAALEAEGADLLGQAASLIAQSQSQIARRQ